MERELFLQRLRSRGGGRFLDEETVATPWQRPLEVDPVAAFTRSATAVGAHVLVAPSPEELLEMVRLLNLPHPRRSELMAEPFAGLAAALGAEPIGGDRDGWFGSGTGLVEARAAAIATGTLLVVRTPGHVLAASLVPPVLLAFLRSSRLEPDIETMILLPELRERSGAMITGPSRSADIENDLTVGVHGPGEVHIAILDDRQGS